VVCVTEHSLGSSVGLSVYRSVCLSVCLSECKVYCSKTAKWIWMPFGMVSGVGRGMGVLGGVVIIENEGVVLRVNFGRPIVTNGDFATRLFPNYFCRTCYNVFAQ